MNGLALRVSPKYFASKENYKGKEVPVIHVPPRLLQSAENPECVETDILLKLLQKLNVSTTVEDQMSVVKEISKNLSALYGRGTKDKTFCTYLTVLTDLYLRSPLKHPIKCALTKTLNALPLETQASSIMLLEKGLQDLVKLALESQDMIDLNVAISALYGCHENLIVGPTVVQNHLSHFLKFLCTTLHICSESLKTMNSPILKSETCKLLHSTTRIIISTLQKRTGSLVSWQELITLLSELLLTCGHLMNHPDIPLDTRSNCGIVVVLALDCLGGQGSWFELLDYENTYKDVLGSDMKDDVTYLCVCSGLLSGIDWHQLLHRHPTKDHAVIACILDLVLHINKRGVQESGVVLAVWRVIQQITRTLTSHHQVVTYLQASQLASLLELVWGQLDHYMDTVRHLARSILQNLLELKEPLSALGVDLAAVMTEAVLQLPEAKRSRYVVLSLLATNLGTVQVLKMVPGVIDMLLQALQCPASVSHASSAMISLLTAHFHELPTSDWTEIWLNPLLTALENTSGTEVNAIEEVLGKAVKLCPAIISNVLPQTLVSEDISTPQMKTMLTCMKIGRKQGVMVSKSEDKVDFWRGMVPVTFLNTSLCHQDDEIRLSSLALIVESNRSTEILSSTDFSLVKRFLLYNVNHDVPASRQQGLALIAKLLVRLKDSAHTLHRTIELGKEDASNSSVSLDIYREFIQWMVQFSFSNLLPGANFSRRCCSLKILTLLQDIVRLSVLFPRTEWNHIFWTTNNAQTLFSDILCDTFEDNKIAAAKLLVSFPPDTLHLDKEERLSSLFKKSCTMASSIHPADCLSAAYIMQICVSFPLSPKVLSTLSGSQSITGTGRHIAIFYAIQCLRIQLETELAVAKHNILLAASNGPMYGKLFCIRHLLQLIPNLSEVEDKPTWQELLGLLIELCFNLNAAVAPVVNSSSPEGHLPMDFDPGSVHLKNDKNASSSSSSVQVTAQMVLLCCWRTVKEVSLFLGELSDSCPILPDKNGLLSEQQLLTIGLHLTTLLEETKHRGAFEQAYVGFCLLSARLWRYPQGSLHELPRQWLNELMDAIQSTTPTSSKLCATRRSAGVPFMVQALVSAELQTGGGSVCLQQSLSKLLSIAEDGNKHVECRTHALNILRALFRHAQLAELVTGFVAKGFIVAISGFRGKTWAERNSATLLFSSLMTRVFGVRRSRGELGWRNKMTGRIFFHRYPELYSFLLTELQRAAAALDTCNAAELATLYPVLLLLARLYPSSLEGTDSTMQLSTFVPWVRQCAGSSVLKTRIIAAQAVVPLVTANVVATYMDNIVQEIGVGCSENMTHGLLLQAVYLLRNTSAMNIEQLTLLQGHIGNWLSVLMVLLHGNRSALVMQTYLQLAELLAENWFTVVPAILWKELEEAIITTYQPVCALAVGRTVYEARAARMLLRLCTLKATGTERILLLLVNHTTTEVVQEALVFLERLLGDEKSCEMYEEEENILVDVNDELGHWAKRLPSDTLREVVYKLCEDKNLGEKLAAFVTSEKDLRSRLALRVLCQLNPSAWHSHLSLDKLLFLCQSHYEGTSCAALECINSLLKFGVSYKGFDIPTACANLGTLMLQFSSEERSVASRTTVVKFLHEHRAALERKYSFLSDEAVCELWTCVLKLLSDDNLNVRLEAAKLAISPVPAVPRRALEILVHEFVQVMSSSLAQCKASLIAWGLGTLPDLGQPEAAEDRVFDKGEMNLFVEQEILTELACEYLSRLNNSSVDLSVAQLNWILCIVGRSNSHFEGSSLSSLFDFIRSIISEGIENGDSPYFTPVSVAGAMHRLSKVESFELGVEGRDNTELTTLKIIDLLDV